MAGARIVTGAAGCIAIAGGTGSRITPGVGLPFITDVGFTIRSGAGAGGRIPFGLQRGSRGGTQTTTAAGPRCLQAHATLPASGSLITAPMSAPASVSASGEIHGLLFVLTRFTTPTFGSIPFAVRLWQTSFTEPESSIIIRLTPSAMSSITVWTGIASPPWHASTCARSRCLIFPTELRRTGPTGCSDREANSCSTVHNLLVTTSATREPLARAIR